MAQYNRQALLHSLHQYRENLDEFIHIIEQHKWELLEEKFKFNQQARPHFVE